MSVLGDVSPLKARCRRVRAHPTEVGSEPSRGVRRPPGPEQRWWWVLHRAGTLGTRQGRPQRPSDAAGASRTRALDSEHHQNTATTPSRAALALPNTLWAQGRDPSRSAAGGKRGSGTASPAQRRGSAPRQRHAPPRQPAPRRAHPRGGSQGGWPQAPGRAGEDAGSPDGLETPAGPSSARGSWRAAAVSWEAKGPRCPSGPARSPSVTGAVLAVRIRPQQAERGRGARCCGKRAWKTERESRQHQVGRSPSPANPAGSAQPAARRRRSQSPSGALSPPES